MEYKEGENLFNDVSLDKYKKKKGPAHPRAEVVEQVCLFMGDGNKRFGYWLGRTKHLTPSQIYDKIREAKEGYNPQGLFNYLIKNKK